jgi:NAD(P)-dependent dehydrogenase (short-subunit alcohol dehydrogenase family)
MGMLEGKVVLVTGASAGIGRAAVRLFCREGAHVVATARREAEGRAAVLEAGNNARFKAADLRDRASIDSLFAFIESEFGRLDGAFNNAAMTQDASSIVDTPVELYEQIFDTNVRSVWLCMKHELRIMQRQRAGAIVNTASIAGTRGFPGLSLYSASKHAVIGMTKSAALDAAAFGVRVNCICPGTTRTEMMEQQMRTRPGGEEETIKGIPLGRVSAPEEQAEAAAWLLSDRASFVTGEQLIVDGGRTVR